MSQTPQQRGAEAEKAPGRVADTADLRAGGAAQHTQEATDPEATGQASLRGVGSKACASSKGDQAHPP